MMDLFCSWELFLELEEYPIFLECNKHASKLIIFTSIDRKNSIHYHPNEQLLWTDLVRNNNSSSEDEREDASNNEQNSYAIVSTSNEVLSG